MYECCTAKMIDIVSSSDRTMTVGECCESIYSGGTPSTKKAAYWNGNLPWLSSGETRCRFIIDTEKTITELGVAESSTKLAKAGDVVMASAGQGFTRGQTSMLFFDTYVNQSVVVMRPKRDYGAYLLLMLAAQYDNLRAWSDSTSTRGSMSGKLLRQFELPYFDVEQAKELTAFTAPMFAMIENNMRESKALAQTRDALLPKLMSGEIDVSEVELPKQLNSHLYLSGNPTTEVEHGLVKKAVRAPVVVHLGMFVQESIDPSLEVVQELPQVEVDFEKAIGFQIPLHLPDAVAAGRHLVEDPELYDIEGRLVPFNMRCIDALVKIHTAQLIAVVARKVAGKT